MSHIQRTHPLADAELIEAARWYESGRFGLGDAFLDSGDEAVREILDWPQIAQVFPGWDREPVVRSKNIRRFPYRILHYFDDNELLRPQSTQTGLLERSRVIWPSAGLCA